MSPQRIYLAGPVTGLPDANKPAFAFAQQQIERMGHFAINPHTLVANARINPADWQACMRLCINRLTMGAGLTSQPIDMVVMLPGWQQSRGATLERTIALTLGIPVKTIEELQHG